MQASRKISVTDLRGDFPRVLEAVGRGERIAVTRYGRTVAMIVAVDHDAEASTGVDLDAAYAGLDRMGETPSASVLDLFDEGRGRYDRSTPSEQRSKEHRMADRDGDFTSLLAGDWIHIDVVFRIDYFLDGVAKDDSHRIGIKEAFISFEEPEAEAERLNELTDPETSRYYVQTAKLYPVGRK